MQMMVQMMEPMHAAENPGISRFVRPIRVVALGVIGVLLACGSAHAISYSWGWENFGARTRTVEVDMYSYCQDPAECGDCDGMLWKGITVEYELLNNHFAVLHRWGMVSIAQYGAAVGPEFGRHEIGLMGKATLGFGVFPLSLSLIPRYDYGRGRFSAVLRTEAGIGALSPFFGVKHKHRK